MYKLARKVKHRMTATAEKKSDKGCKTSQQDSHDQLDLFDTRLGRDAIDARTLNIARSWLIAGGESGEIWPELPPGVLPVEPGNRVAGRDRGFLEWFAEEFKNRDAGSTPARDKADLIGHAMAVAA